MLSNGCFVSIPKPLNADTDYGDECVVVNITHENNYMCIIINNLCMCADYLTIMYSLCIKIKHSYRVAVL